MPSTVSRPESRPDFARGFGLNIPEEEEEDEEVEDAAEDAETQEEDMEEALEPEEQIPEEETSIDIETAQASTVEYISEVHKSSVHTRHASRVSVALSVGSVGKPLDETMIAHSRHGSLQMPYNVNEAEASPAVEKEFEHADPLNEWTGSEDVRSVDNDLDDQEVSSIRLKPIMQH